MSSVIFEYPGEQTWIDGSRYVGRVLGERDASGRWCVWHEFTARDGVGPSRRMPVAPTFPSPEAARDWAAALPESHIHGAFMRAS